MLKLLEEPPASTIFIFCTTDPQKIPRTILSRVQRYNFQRISKEGIIKRLKYIIDCENMEFESSWQLNDVEADKERREKYYIEYEDAAVDYIAKQAQGGMRDAITTLDKCLSYSKDLSLKNVVDVLSAGVTPYDLSEFTLCLLDKDTNAALDCLNQFFMSGIDMGLLVNSYFEFLLNLQKYLVLGSKEIANLPADLLNKYNKNDSDHIRTYITKLYSVIIAPKMNVKSLLEAWVIERCI